MPTTKVTRNDFKLFATAQNANVLSNASYFASPYVGPGVKEGVASAALYNKTLRQLSIISVALATYLQGRLEEDLVDNGSIDTIVDQIKRAIGKQASEDVKIPEGSLTKKGILQLSETLSESLNNDDNAKAATIGVVSKLHRRIKYLESLVNNTYRGSAGNPAYNPMYDWVIPVGTVKVYFNKATDPNALYPGTRWEKVNPGIGLRTAKEDGTDLNQVKGKDSVTLSADQLPNFSLGIALTTSSFDYGSKTSAVTDLGSPGTSSYNHGTITASTFDYGTKGTTGHDYGTVGTSTFDYGTKTAATAGAHSHYGVPSRADPWDIGGSTWQRFNFSNIASTDASGDHSHSVWIGAHSHTVYIGAHSHSVGIGTHNHTVAIGAHSHSVALGSHTHGITIGAHSHTVTGNTSSIGKGYSIDIVNTYLGVVAWKRVA